VGIPFHQGGRDHTSHRLSALGFSERRTVLVVYAITAVLAGVGLLTQIVSPLVLPLLTLSIVALVVFGIFLGQVALHPHGGNEGVTPITAKLSTYVRFGLEVILDVTLLTTAYYTAYAIRFEGFQYSDWAQPFVVTLPIVVAVQLLTFVLSGVYKTLWRYLGSRDVVIIVRATVLAAIPIAIGLFVLFPIQGASRAVLIVDAVLVSVLIVGARVFLVWLFDWADSRGTAGERRAVIVGAAGQGLAAIRYLRNVTPVPYLPLGFIDDDRGKRYRRLAGLPILGDISELERIVEQNDVQTIVIASTDVDDVKRVREICLRIGIECREFGLA
jgi:UDP-GlcNAc:undecaprenyl-phosphate GlcNAc-1-phosphate transferase